MTLFEIEAALEALLRDQETFQVGDLVARTGRTRQALHAHLTRWLREGRLVREGRGRATRYRAAPAGEGPGYERLHPLAGLSEDGVWADLRTWLDDRFPRSDGADRILHYAVTEVVNNAIDHSGAATVAVRARASATVTVEVSDEGVGAFENLRARLGLEDHLHALQELSKGKVTTQPDRHTGEGLFFVSKAVARFELRANGLAWCVDNERADHTIRTVDPRPGTLVRFELAPDPLLHLEDLFAAYTHDLEFDTTRCVVRLFEHGVRFVSRSEAKRLVAGLDRFREVILDFRGVETVGQGFVDEVFRVWARAHPGTRLEPRHMSPAVEFMVRRGLPPRDR